MTKFVLTTDTSCDIPRNELDNMGIAWTPLTFVIDGETYEDNFSDDKEYKAFYNKIKHGVMPTTSQINIFTHEEFFENAIKNGATQILHLSLSGGLSNTANSAKLAASNVEAKHSGVKIMIVDTLSATQGHRFVLEKAQSLQKEGLDLEQAYNKITAFCSRVHHALVVDDLMHLKRGGRVSGAAAHIGSMLKVKPILIINHQGKLSVIKKAIGFNKAINELVKLAKENVLNPENAEFIIADADCPHGFTHLKEALEHAFPACQIKKGWIGPVIGSHTGAGTLGLVYEGKARLEN